LSDVGERASLAVCILEALWWRGVVSGWNQKKLETTLLGILENAMRVIDSYLAMLTGSLSFTYSFYF